MKAERDKLLAEKEALSKAAPATAAPAGAPAPSTWETEKAALAKARDEALQKAKVCSLTFLITYLAHLS